MIIIILILYNFASVSITSNNTYGSKSYNNINATTTQYNSIQNPLPSPVLSKSPSALNNKVNLNAQAYDYKKYFFV